MCKKAGFVMEIVTIKAKLLKEIAAKQLVPAQLLEGHPFASGAQTNPARTL